jgi:hypothetical protein
MTEPGQEIGRLARIIEVIFFILAVPVMLGFLYVLARFIMWALDRNYHLFLK